MRVSKYRGMTDNKKWLYGYYGVKGIDTEFEEHYIITDTLGIYADHTYPFYFTDNKVIKETVGQFTGLHDKNGVEIYEGDIVKVFQPFVNEQKAVVEFNDGCFDLKGIELTWRDYVKCFVVNRAIEVIGNIHERSEEL